jgi:transcription termination factor Rho
LVENGKMPEEDENNLESLSISKLRELAKARGIKNSSKMNKAELLGELDKDALNAMAASTASSLGIDQELFESMAKTFYENQGEGYDWGRASNEMKASTYATVADIE